MEFTPAHARVVEDSERPRGGVEWVEKEHMFEKVVTPSDVGKLNRLVIPKQHAERYFPALDASAAAAAAAAGSGKGLVLSFEDRAGKAWRFRYSYWNSSQSYVMTKGWSRFVKEKRLGAGDTVLFARGAGGEGPPRGRFFIDFRRRRQDLAFLQPPLASAQRLLPLPSVPICPWQDYGGSARAPSRHVLFLRPQVPAAVVLTSMPVHVAAAAVEATRSKRVRLFGVNLDCPPDAAGDGATVTRTASTLLQLPSPSSSTSSSTAGKDVCSLDLGL
jgi:hypothetical protein